jgi:phenol 2-monooxygenase
MFSSAAAALPVFVQQPGSHGTASAAKSWTLGQEPLEVGQADGVQCRTVEVFESFGIVEELLREAYHVLEVTFWNPDGKGGGIVRTRSAADTAPGLSHQPHVILNQARINGLLLGAMRRFNRQEVDYGYKVLDVRG